MQRSGNASFLHKWVSGPRRRLVFPDLGIDLDGAYIDDRFLALSYPATGVYSFYRNPVGEVVRFLESQHPGHYQVYNLGFHETKLTPHRPACSNRILDVTLPHIHLPQSLERQVLLYPWADHTPPTLAILVKLTQSIMEYLAKDERNVAVVHCKAGKGRTGIIACAYLLASGSCPRGAQEAMDLYGEKRTTDGRGVTIRGQQRYLRYLEDMLLHRHFDVHSLLEDKRLSNPRPFRLVSLTLTLPASATSSQAQLMGSKPSSSTSAKPRRVMWEHMGKDEMNSWMDGGDDVDLKSFGETWVIGEGGNGLRGGYSRSISPVEGTHLTLNYSFEEV
ncbi:protein-tyrosine phosphatase-like protein [Piptocephalis cylindrospora]|uniref:Protein-tyrosine phosphatase-like protein n=1 Tax=Piptocephalis cylindrospora TaxID=1907219 RepID=A0A4P9Y7B4_9FUNG|nr:protein-tyrosine phosphatase-like protein [Piptocephalis cylindrospora]|eukprot:RKP13770.1 protein-tyrosine phosphatase-like protein [Piptocephalis cylindrospora]